MSDIAIHSEKDTVTAAQEAASALSHIITKYRQVPILLLLSGGSPLEILKYFNTDGLDSRVTVSVSDERFDTDPSINNFAQLLQTSWYKNTVAKGVRSIDTRPVAGETVEDSGRRFDAALKTWRENNPTGNIVITQGIGLDGHTVGMMPARHRYAQALAGEPGEDDTKNFYELFDNSNVWAVGYDANRLIGDPPERRNKYPLRVTTTMPFLRMVDHSVLFVCGENKREALLRTLSKEGSLATTPARIIHQMKHCLLFTDLSIDRV